MKRIARSSLVLLGLLLLSGRVAATVTHIFIFDTSGSMKPAWANSNTAAFVKDGLLANPLVILPEEQAIARAFHLEPSGPFGEEFGQDDSLRLYPEESVRPFTVQTELAEFARQVAPALRATSEDTDLHQAIRKALLDWERLASGGPAIIWMLTDNWQDVAGKSSGIDGFYSVLGFDPRFHAIQILPLLRNPYGVEGNLVLYAIGATEGSTDADLPDLDSRLDGIRQAAMSGGFLADALVPISCKGGRLLPPRIAQTPEPSFERAGTCEARFAVNGRTLEFSDLSLGVPLEGAITFWFESCMSEWIFRNVRVGPVTFSFSNAYSTGLQVPDPQSAYITPPIIDVLEPGKRCTASFRMEFPTEGLFRPKLAGRSLRTFFPGKTAFLEGQANWAVGLDLSDPNVDIASQALADLADRIRLINGLRALMQHRAGPQQTLDLAQQYDTRFTVRINDWLTWLGPVLLGLLGIAGGGIAFLAMQTRAVRYAISGADPHRALVSALRPAPVETAGTRIGTFKRSLFGKVSFVPWGPGNRPTLVQRDPQMVTVRVPGNAFSVKLSLD